MKISLELPHTFPPSEGVHPLVGCVVDNAIDVPNRPLSSGVIVMIAGTRGGKSQSAAELAAELAKLSDVKIAVLAYGEPQVSKYMNQLSCPPAYTVDQLIQYLALVLQAGATHVVLDSIRLIQYQAEGAASAGGMSTGTFELMTQLSMVCHAIGLTMILPFNPNVKEDVYPVVRRAMEGSIHSVIDLSGDNGGGAQITCRELDRNNIAYVGPETYLSLFHGGNSKILATPTSPLVRYSASAVTPPVTMSSDTEVAINMPHSETEPTLVGVNLSVIKQRSQDL